MRQANKKGKETTERIRVLKAKSRGIDRRERKRAIAEMNTPSAIRTFKEHDNEKTKKITEIREHNDKFITSRPVKTGSSVRAVPVPMGGQNKIY